MRLPEFLCVGASKSGTTSLHNILVQHPEIYLPKQKEIHFFDNDDNFKKGIDWYKQHFYDAKQDNVIGEITPDYMFYDFAPQRMKTALGENVKLIFMLRDPVERAYSEYLFNVRRGYFNKPFEEVIEDEKSFDPNKFENRYYIHIYRSLYSQHIKNIQQTFKNAENITYIIFEEDFLKNKQKTFSDLYEFLKVPYYELDLNQVFKPAYVPKYQFLQKMVYQPNTLRKVVRNFLPSYKFRRKLKDQWLPRINNSNEKVEKVNAELRKELIEKYFKDDIKKTEDLIKRDLSIWLA